MTNQPQANYKRAGIKTFPPIKIGGLLSLVRLRGLIEMFLCKAYSDRCRFLSAWKSSWASKGK
jgi:hypothetical protein